MKIPGAVKRLIGRLEQNGYKAYVVGGCVRDSLRGQKPKDWDICTSALPEQAIACFSPSGAAEPFFSSCRILMTGLKHGTITVLAGQEAYEVTTFRIDGKYSNHRHPDQVQFVADLKEDLARRDFTINAMAFHHSTGLVDYFGGEADLKAKLIRCVGDADVRFQEDALRILRALRFASQFDFTICAATKDSIHTSKNLLRSISAERIQEEFRKILLGTGVFDILQKYVDVFCVCIPEIEPMIEFYQNTPYHDLDVWQHTIKAVENAAFDLEVRLALFFHDISKPHTYSEDDKGIGHFYDHARQSAIMAESILKRLTFSNEIVSNVTELITHHSMDFLPQQKHVKKWLGKVGEVQFRRLIEMKRADTLAHHPDCIPERLSCLDKIPIIINEIVDESQCYQIKDLAISGYDLIQAGIPEGIEIGKTLCRLLEMVIDDQVPNQKKALLDVVMKEKGSFKLLKNS